MKKILLVFITSIWIVIPQVSQAAAPQTFLGTVTAINPGVNGSQITLATVSAAIYFIQTWDATLIRKNGTAMQVGDIIVGDKLQITGLGQGGNIILATLIRDLSLYPHRGTFTGKIVTINPWAATLSMLSKQWGFQTIQTNMLTVFQQNSTSVGLKDLEPGMNVTVKGVWDRTYATVNATLVQAKIRMIAIYFTGALRMRGADALTVAGSNNAIYGVDISHAQILDGKGQPILFSQLPMDGGVRVWGKHLSGSVQVVASKVREQ